MAIKLVLTAPIARPSITNYEVTGFEMNTIPEPLIHAIVRDNIGNIGHLYYTAAEGAADKIAFVCSADLRTKTLPQLILESFVADGKLPAGTVQNV